MREGGKEGRVEREGGGGAEVNSGFGFRVDEDEEVGAS
jgi:hypothetical protein